MNARKDDIPADDFTAARRLLIGAAFALCALGGKEVLNQHGIETMRAQCNAESVDVRAAAHNYLVERDGVGCHI